MCRGNGTSPAVKVRYGSTKRSVDHYAGNADLRKVCPQREVHDDKMQIFEVS
jgi:hypothetical protein